MTQEPPKPTPPRRPANDAQEGASHEAENQAGKQQTPPQAEDAPGPQLPSTVYDDLLAKIVNSRRPSDHYFWLCVTPLGGEPEWQRYETVEELVDAIRELEGREVIAHPFLGHKLSITPRPLRYLVTPFGRLPLFDEPDVTQDHDGYMGVEAEALDSLTYVDESGEDRGTYGDEEDYQPESPGNGTVPEIEEDSDETLEDMAAKERSDEDYEDHNP